MKILNLFRLLVFANAICVPFSLQAQKLQPGSLAVVGYNADNPDEFCLLALDTLPADTTVYITDNGWDNTSFRDSEGTLVWSLPDTIIPAGNLLVFNLDGDGSLTAGSLTFDPRKPSLSASGDQLLIYAGSADSPDFLFAFNAEGDSWQTAATSSNESALPADLEEGQTAMALPEADNGVYTGPRNGSREALLINICNPENWETSNSDRQEMPQGLFTFSSNTNIDTDPPLPDTLSSDPSYRPHFPSPGSSLARLMLQPEDGEFAGYIRLRFTEPLLPGAGKAVLKKASETVHGDSIHFQNATAFIPQGDSGLLILAPSVPLVGNTHYHLHIPEGFVTDTAGNKFAGFSTDDFTFSTSNRRNLISSFFSHRTDSLLFATEQSSLEGWRWEDADTNACLKLPSPASDSLLLVSPWITLWQTHHTHLSFFSRFQGQSGQMAIFYSSNRERKHDSVSQVWQRLDPACFLFPEKSGKWEYSGLHDIDYLPADSIQIAFVVYPSGLSRSFWQLDNISLSGTPVPEGILETEQEICSLNMAEAVSQTEETDTINIPFTISFSTNHPDELTTDVKYYFQLESEQQLKSGSFIELWCEETLIHREEVCPDSTLLIMDESLNTALKELETANWTLITNGLPQGSNCLKLYLHAGYTSSFMPQRSVLLGADSIYFNIDPLEILSPEVHFSLYPNPAKEVIYIRSYTPFTGPALLRLHDMLGREKWCHRIQLSGKTVTNVPIQQVKAGFYILRLETKSRSYSWKVLIR